MRARRLLAIALSLWLAPVAARGQARPPTELETTVPGGAIPENGDTTLRAWVSEVALVFTVTDRQGRFVNGLSAFDFRVEDAGEPLPAVTYFQSQSDLPLHIAVAIDLSGSVDSRVKFEVRVTTQFLRRILRPEDSVFIIGFNSHSYVFRDLDSAGPQLLELHRRSPTAGTAVYDAVVRACDMLAQAGARDPGHRDVLLLLTDGEDNNSQLSETHAQRTIVRRGVVALVIDTGSGRTPPWLKRLADNSGGQVFDGSAIGLLKSLTKVEQALRAQYVLAYRPPHFELDGSFRPVRLQARRDGLRVHCRRGYYADPPDGR